MQLNLLRSVVHEESQAVRQELVDMLQNMHIEMIRQFHMQKVSDTVFAYAFLSIWSDCLICRVLSYVCVTSLCSHADTL